MYDMGYTHFLANLVQVRTIYQIALKERHAVRIRPQHAIPATSIGLHIVDRDLSALREQETQNPGADKSTSPRYQKGRFRYIHFHGLPIHRCKKGKRPWQTAPANMLSRCPAYRLMNRRK